LSSKLYVGNLPFSSSQDELHDLFSRHGEVVSVNVITDRETGRPRGFAFVEMEDSESADNAVRALDGVQLGGRTIKVNPAQDRRNERGGNDRGGSDRGGFDRAPRRY
jgi:RNA recognition motif-containing protein